MTRRETALAGVLYCALTFALAWPLSVHPASTPTGIGPGSGRPSRRELRG
jgi:hypothetical protein